MFFLIKISKILRLIHLKNRKGAFNKNSKIQKYAVYIKNDKICDGTQF